MSNLEKLKQVVGMVGKDPYEGMSDNEKKLARMEKILSVVNEGVTKKDFTESFKKVIEIVLKTQQKNEEEIKLLTQAYNQVVDSIDQKHQQSLSDISNKVDHIFVGGRVSKMEQEHAMRMALIRNGIDGQPGKDSMIPGPIGPSGKDGKNGSPDKPQEIRDKLESLKGSDRLDKSAIRGLTEFLSEINKRAGDMVGSAKGFFLYINGSKYGFNNTVDFYGTGVTTSVVNGLRRITFAGSGGGTTWKGWTTPTGSVNSSNVTFTLADTPVSGSLTVVLNGAVQVDGGVDYTLAGTTITFVNAPLTGATLRVNYATSSSATWKGWVVPTGTINGINAAFTLANTPTTGSLTVVLNGALQIDGGVDYTLAGTTVTFVNAPLTNSVLYVNYQL